MAAVCSTCNDTHRMLLGEEGRPVPCTGCPLPCGNCVTHFNGMAAGAYCAETPCGCDCHRPKAEPHAPPWPSAIEATEAYSAAYLQRDAALARVKDLESENARLEAEVADLVRLAQAGQIALARLKVERQWIQVGERMPERRTRVWFFVSGVRHGWFNGEDFVSDAGFGFRPKEVSHWMPCAEEPEPPK